MATRRPTATTLAAYRRAGGLLYELTTLAEERRRELAGGGVEVEVSDSDRQLMLCAWSALALQTLGDALADGAGPRDKMTAVQAARFYEDVSDWVAAGQQAAAGAVTVSDSELPVALRLDSSKRWSSEHVQAMLAACGALRARSETAPLDARSVSGATEPQIQVLRSQLARATAKADFATQACENVRFSSLTRALRGQVQSAVADALNGFFLTGQIAAMPHLAGRARASSSDSHSAPSVVETRRQPQRRALLAPVLLVLLAIAGAVRLTTGSEAQTTRQPRPTAQPPISSRSWGRYRPYVVKGVVQEPIGGTDDYEPDTSYQNVERIESTVFAAARRAIVDAHPHPTGPRLISALILSSPSLPEPITTSKDPAEGTGNLLATPDSAVPAATAGIGIGESNQKQFVAIAYTAAGTRCVFRFVYRTGIATITP